MSLRKRSRFNVVFRFVSFTSVRWTMADFVQWIKTGPYWITLVVRVTKYSENLSQKKRLFLIQHFYTGAKKEVVTWKDFQILRFAKLITIFAHLKCKIYFKNSESIQLVMFMIVAIWVQLVNYRVIELDSVFWNEQIYILLNLKFHSWINVEHFNELDKITLVRR